MSGKRGYVEGPVTQKIGRPLLQIWNEEGVPVENESSATLRHASAACQSG
ncbi:hypothetical protein [Duncaniella dubosii]